MTTEEVMRRLASLGTAQNRKVYARHGVGDEMFGVSSAALDKLKKEIKKDQALAEALWATRNHDARVLATKIADPKTLTSEVTETWLRDLDNYVITDAFSKMMAATPLAESKMQKWTKSAGEWSGRAGWTLLAHLAMQRAELEDDYFLGYLKTIAADIHTGKNRVRDAMNNALIAIGLRNEILKRKAIAAAKRIGKVEVDHGETNCDTPEAVPYIERAWQRKRGKPS